MAKIMKTPFSSFHSAIRETPRYVDDEYLIPHNWGQESRMMVDPGKTAGKTTNAPKSVLPALPPLTPCAVRKHLTPLERSGHFGDNTFLGSIRVESPRRAMKVDQTSGRIEGSCPRRKLGVAPGVAPNSRQENTVMLFCPG